MLKKKIISQFNFLGLNLYKRTRDSKKEISIQNAYDKHFFIGLYPLVKYPKLEYDFISLYQQKDWDKTALELIYKAFMHLLFVKAIKISSFIDNKTILGVFNFKTKGFQIKIKEPYFTEDIFLNVVIKSIKETNDKYRDKSNFKYNVKLLLDDFLGSNYTEHNRPEKKLITRLIKRYTKKYSWLELEKESKYLGLISNYKVKIEESRLLFLKDGFRSLSLISRKEKSINRDLVLFERELSNIIRNDFHRRYPSSDND